MNPDDFEKPEAPDTRWECVLKTDSRQRAHIIAGHFISADIPAVIVPKVASAYSFALPGQFEIWVPLLKAPDAINLLYDEPADESGPIQPI